ncbi:unnamed protein product [Cladocopium goreaui]|uniref:Histone-lysine N-methyltransferase SET5 (SE T domain-containing protein 5) n=1 Tax=Cladocopium goreaui TaxID=2562237 RepID=A0A9P1CBI4_9DINO|nr:unnamed protein product [Cladocopium goreaui]
MPAGHGRGYEVTEVAGHGLGVVALRDFKANEFVFQECSLMTVKTYTLLSGVLVLRREKVETKYDLLSDAEQRQYRSLHPVADGAAAAAASETDAALRQRLGTSSAGAAQAVAALSAQEHLKIWESCGFHYCDSSDVKRNQVLHLMICPAFLSVFTGACYAYRFQGQITKSILAAGVLFFAIMGPICARLFYFGSQGLFLTASRLNHSCLPNCQVQIEAKAPGSPQLSLCTKQQLQKGQELTIDYISELQHLDLSERRKLLEQDYGFNCSCPRCAGAASAASAATEEEEES